LLHRGPRNAKTSATAVKARLGLRGSAEPISALAILRMLLKSGPTP